MNMESVSPHIPAQEAARSGLTHKHAAPLVVCVEERIGWWRLAFLHVSFLVLFALSSPIYYLNRWDCLRHKKLNPFYTSKLQRLEAWYPLLYELVNFVETFPAWDGGFDVLPHFSGDVLQVGCGTGILNRRMRHRKDIRFTNLDPNLRALRTGVWLKRFASYVHGSIENSHLPDASFDVILFTMSYHHIRNHKKTLAECARLLRPGGGVIIADPVILHEKSQGLSPTGYMVNSSVDGVIWSFTLEAFVKHLEKCVPPELAICSVKCTRPPHINNYNAFVPQADVVATMVKGEGD